ncbi:MAG: hypothetical protein AB1347_02045 [Acidobacteriota bacterium]
MDRYPDGDHFQAVPPPAGAGGFTVAVGGLSVGFEGVLPGVLGTCRDHYRPFLSDAIPQVTFRLGPGWENYLDLPPDGYLRLEERPLGPGRVLLSHTFATLWHGASGELRSASLEDFETLKAGIENTLRWVVADLALESHGFVLHASGLVRNGRAYLFFGHSGAGKSTVASLSPDCLLLSDDLVLLVRREGTWMAATTPFAGTLPQTHKQAGLYPLAALYRLVQAPEDFVQPLSLAEAAGRVLSCCPFVTDPPARQDRLFPLVEACCRAVPVRALHFTKSRTFWALAAPEATP